MNHTDNSLAAHTQEITTLQESQKFISDKYDTVLSASNVNKQNVTKVQGECKRLTDETNKLTKENSLLKSENAKLHEELIDVQCRSMRENLLFMNIPEVSVSEAVAGGAGVGSFGMPPM